MFKLVAIDLDGTLLNSQKEVSEVTKETIRKVKQTGTKLVLCSGRPTRAMGRILDELNLREPEDYNIAFNGGVIQKADTNEIIHQVTLTKSDSLDIYHTLMELNVPCSFIDLDHIHEPPYPEGRPSLYPTTMKALKPKPIRLDEMTDDFKANKIVVHTEPAYIDEAIARLPKSFYERFSIMKSHPFMLEFMHKEADKGKGLKQLTTMLEIRPEEVLALGDEENDLEMIQFAGTGVAMGNASDQIKDEASFITKSNDEHGVAYALEKFILNG